MILDLLQLLIYGVVLGSVLALGAVGVSLLYGILRFANFAHGDLMAVGAYGALTMVWLGLPLIIAAPFGIVLAVLVAMLVDRLVYRKLRRTQPVILLISSFGIGMILRSLIQIIWGPGTQVYASGVQLPFHWQGLVFKPNHIWIVLGAFLLVFATHLFMTRSRMGKAMRAMSDNMDLAAISGIPAERVILWTWALGASLAAAAGIFIGMDTRLFPDMGGHVLMLTFAAAILGGLGRPYGAILGGLVIGITSEMSTYLINPSYKQAVAFGIMVLVLIMKPEGLFGGKKS